MLRYLRKFSRDRNGASAVELTLIAPFLLLLLGLVVDYGLFLSQRGNMSSAVTSGTRYFMLGGTDNAEARSIVESAWEGRPENATVTVGEVCFCVDAEHACDTLCPDSSAPETFLTIRASAMMEGLFDDRALNFEDDVRVR